MKLHRLFPLALVVTVFTAGLNAGAAPGRTNAAGEPWASQVPLGDCYSLSPLNAADRANPPASPTLSLAQNPPSPDALPTVEPVDPGPYAVTLSYVYLPLILKQVPVIDLTLDNPSFEEGWTDDPVSGQQIPNGWSFYSPADDQAMPIPPYISDGPGEYVHKCWWQLPQFEQQGGDRALILDGVVTYKAFGGRAHAILLSQTFQGTPGDTYQVVVYILGEYPSGDPYNPPPCPEDDSFFARVSLGDTEDLRNCAQMVGHEDFEGTVRDWNRFEVTEQFPESGQLVLEIVMQNNRSTSPFADFFIDNLSGQIVPSP